VRIDWATKPGTGADKALLQRYDDEPNRLTFTELMPIGTCATAQANGKNAKTGLLSTVDLARWTEIVTLTGGVNYRASG